MDDRRLPARLTTGNVALVLAILGALGLLVLLLLDLGEGSIWNTDDALYGLVVRRMVAARALTPPTWFDYDIAHTYPLGVRWMALVAAVFGTGLFGLRMGAVLACVGSAAALCALSAPRDRRGWFAAGLWLVQPLVYLFSQRVLHDMLLAALCALAICLAVRAGRRGRSLLSAGVVCGLASLVKMGAGLLPLVAIGLELVLFRRLLLRRGRTWLAFALALAIPGGWLVRDAALLGMVAHLRERFLVGLEGHGAPPGALAAAPVEGGRGALAVLVEQGAAGWLALALGLAGLVVAARRRDIGDRLALCWLVVATGVLTLSRTFLPQYALLVLLPLCVLGGGALAALDRRLAGRGAVAAAGVALLLLGPLVPLSTVARHADDRTAALAALQRAAPAEALLCTVDHYHAAPTFYADRPVLYLTEDAASRRILRRVFGEATVPTLAPGELARRLDAAEALACLVERDRLAALMPSLQRPVEVTSPSPSLPGPELVLLSRGLGPGRPSTMTEDR